MDQLVYGQDEPGATPPRWHPREHSAIEEALGREFDTMERDSIARWEECGIADVELRTVGRGKVTVMPVEDQVPATPMEPEYEAEFSQAYYERTGRWSVVASRAAFREARHQGYGAIKDRRPVRMFELMHELAHSHPSEDHIEAPTKVVVAPSRTKARARAKGAAGIRTRGSRRTAASSRSGGSDPGSGESDPEPPPGLSLWWHPRWGSCTPNLLRVLLRADRKEGR